MVGREAVSPVDPMAVLAELFDLLEEYAPAWYTEEHHDRAVAALLAMEGPVHSSRASASQLQA
jgi:hypothetical protein